MDCKKDCKKLNIKNFIMGRWFPLILALLIIGLIFTVGFLFGFRITYAPELKNDWEAISGVATWAEVIVAIISVIASVMAVWYAIQVPQKIAERQDRIALFEKRCECYTIVQSLLVCASQLMDARTNKGVQVAFRTHMDDPENIQNVQNINTFTLRLKRNERIVVSGAFLFSVYNVNALQKIIDTGIELIMAAKITAVNEADNLLSDHASELKQEYIQLCHQYRENGYVVEMEKELKL